MNYIFGLLQYNYLQKWMEGHCCRDDGRSTLNEFQVPRSVDMLVGYPTLILHDLQGSTSHKKGTVSELDPI